jgi:hypothetical protein
MDFPSLCQQVVAVFRDQRHGTANIGSAHTMGTDRIW